MPVLALSISHMIMGRRPDRGRADSSQLKAAASRDGLPSSESGGGGRA